MEFEKLKEIIADVLNVEVNDITEDTTFVDDLGADSLISSRLLWEWKKHLTLRSIMKKQKRSLQLEMLLNRSRKA